MKIRTAVLVLAVVALAAVTIIASPDNVTAQGGPQQFESDPFIAGGVGRVGPELAAVWVSHLVGDELWIGGEFDSARDAPFGSPELATNNLAVININTGAVVQKSFNFDGPVYGLDYNDGVVYVAGNFDNYNGMRARNIAAIEYDTLEMVDGFNGESNAQLRDVVYHNGWLYLGGNVSNYNGSGVGRVIRVNPTTGALDAGWSPTVTNFVESLDAQGNFLLAGERDDFRASSETKLISIPLGQKVDGLDPASRQGVWDAKFSTDGQSVYSADVGNAVNKHSTSDVLLWSSLEADGDMQAVDSTDTRVFAGFHEGWLGNLDRRIVSLRPNNGTEDGSWYVEMNSYWGVRDIRIYDQGLVAGGEFSNVNGINARRIAIFRPLGGWNPAQPIATPTPTPTPDLPPNGDVNCDTNTNIVDALIISQYAVGVRVAVDSCPLADPIGQIKADEGDANGDGAVNIVDALLLAQCAAGNTNIFCPAG